MIIIVAAVEYRLNADAESVDKRSTKETGELPLALRELLPLRSAGRWRAHRHRRGCDRLLQSGNVHQGRRWQRQEAWRCKRRQRKRRQVKVGLLFQREA